MEEKVWYLAINGKSVGPMELNTIKIYYKQGKINNDTLAFGPGLTDWTPIKDIPAISSSLSAFPPPPPPPKHGSLNKADEIDYKIIGEEMQFVEVELDPGESAVAEAGAMMYMDSNIEMNPIFGDGSTQEKAKGLLDKFIGAGKRILTGESLFMTLFTNKGAGKAHVAFGAPYAGKIIPLHVTKYGGEIICQKDAFLCAARGISLDIAFQKRIGVGLFGGEGFIMQRLRGDGLVFIHAGGTIIEKQLSPGETIKLDTGCLVAMEPSVDYDVRFVGSIKTALFGGEGLFFATLTGPGHVWLQSLPLSRLADRIYSAAPQTGGPRKGEGSILDRVGLGGFFDGD